MAVKRIALMRHAKSAWDTDAPTDHARPLNKRGRKAAPKVGAELARRGWVPDVVLSSDARRTTETWERMREALGFEGEARFRRDLYHAGLSEVCAALGELGDDVGTVLVLGHNPGWEETQEWLSGHDVVMKTGTVALLTREAPGSWRDALADRGAWTLEGVIYPRDL